MTLHGWLQFGVVAGLFVVLTPPLGGYMARVYSADTAPGERILAIGLRHVHLDAARCAAQRSIRGLGNRLRAANHAPNCYTAAPRRPPRRAFPLVRVRGRGGNRTRE